MKRDSEGVEWFDKNDIEENTVPKVTVYRYTKQDYIDDFFETGSLRLAPLVYYRNVEKLGYQIGDSGEGFSQFYYHQTKPYFGSGLHIPKPLNRVFGEGFNGTVFMEGNVILSDEVAPPCYILCTSEGLSQDLISVFNADDVFAIKSPIEFTHEVARVLYEEHSIRATHAKVAQCRYVWNRQGSNPDIEKPELLKPMGLRHQREVRMIWYVESTLPEIFIKVPNAVKFCERISRTQVGRGSK